MSCLDENTVLAFLDGRLTTDARAAIESHLAGCNACIDLVSLSDSRTVQGGTVAPGQTLLDSAPQNRCAASELTRGFVLAGRYEIQRTLGRGGMGVVVRAFDRVIGENVAIKVLRPEYAEDRRWTERLAREVRLARTIQHPNVCRIFDFGEADGHSFITMELATGGTLRDAIAAAAERSSEDRVADATAVIQGLAAIHAAGIVHRDVTPQNILRMGDGRLVVSDFGLASVATGTTTSVHGGTIAYMAPEVLRGSPANFASDVWGLGLIIGEVLTGARPQNGDEQTAAPLAVASKTSVERKLMGISRSCLALHPSRRPRTAGEVVEILEDRRRVPRRALVRTWLWGALAVATAAAAIGGEKLVRRWASKAVDGSIAPLVIREDNAWLSSSRVLATFEGSADCLMALPTKNTIRVILDEPREAHDIDVETGSRRAANLIPAAIAEGCARLSPDGRKLAYQGRDVRRRPHLMISQTPDGADAAAVIASAEPALSTEPRWLDDESVLFDVGFEHAAVFSLPTGRVTVVPGPQDGKEHLTGFNKSAANSEVLIGYSGDTPLLQNVRIFQWPSVRMTSRFQLEAFVLHWLVESQTVFGSALLGGNSQWGLLRLDRATEIARIARIPERQIRASCRVDSRRLAFIASSFLSEVWVKEADGGERRLIVQNEFAHVARSGAGDLLVSAWLNGRSVIVRYDASGRSRGRLTEGPRDLSPAFFPDGTHWIFERVEGDRGFYRCTLGKDDCRRIERSGPGDRVPTITGLALSPDGQRIAYVTISARGPHVRWMSSDGGPTHEVMDTETVCRPIWASNERLWISRRIDGAVMWVEVNVDSLTETGQRHPGRRDCTAGATDDLSLPIKPAAWVKEVIRSEVRIVTLPED